MKFIVLGDKFQKGMKSKGCPALIKTQDNVPVFVRQYEVIKTKYPSSEIVYVSGFESKRLNNYLLKNHMPDISLVFNENYGTSGDGHSLSLVSNSLDDDTFIIFGHTFLCRQMFSRFNLNNGSQIMISPNDNNLGCILNDGVVTNIAFDLPTSIDNIYYVSKTDIDMLSEYATQTRYRNYFTFELINKMIARGVDIKPFYNKRGR